MSTQDNIVISVTDQVSGAVATKLQGMASSARAASAAISQLQSQLNALNANNLTNGLNAANASNAALGQSVGNLNTAISALNGSIGSLTSQLSNMNSVTNNTTNNITNITNATHGLNAGLVNLAAGLSVLKDLRDGVESVAGVFLTVTQWQASLDRFNIGMKLISSSAQGTAANTQFITGLVQKLGLEMDATNLSFIRFAAATKDTNLQGVQTQQIFTSIAEAASVLHLTAQQTNNVFLALEQMASKGTVSMEELRRQLGNYIPGAMKLAADAMGVTEAQLQQMIKAGQVAADDFLPKFAEAVHKNYGDAVVESSESAQASLNRFSNAWTQLERTIADSGVGTAAKNQLGIVTDAVNGISEAIQRAKNSGSGFWGQAAAGAGGVLSFLNPANAFGYQAQSVEGLKTQIKQWQDQLKTTTDLFQQKQLAYNIQHNQTLLTTALAGQPASVPASSTNLDPTRAAELQAQQNQAAVSKFLNSGKHETREEQLQNSLKEIDNEFKQATAHLTAGSDLYNQALAAATARKNELQEKYDKPAIRQAHRDQQNQLSAEITEWQGYADARKQILQTDLASLTEQRNDGLLTETEYIKKVGDAHNKELTDLQVIAQQQADLASGKDQLSARQKYLSEVQKLNEQLVTNEATTQVQLTALAYKTRQTAASQLLSLDQVGTNRNRSNANSLAGIGLSSNQQQELQVYQQIQQRADQARLALQQQAEKLGTVGSKEYIDGMAKIAAAEQSQLADEKQYFAERDRLQSDWSNGAVAAMNTFADQAKNVAGQTQTLFTNAFNGLTDALTTFVTTGKLSFTDLVNSILTGIIKMELQAAESTLFKTLFSAAGIQGSAAGGSILAGFDGGGYTGSFGTKQIAGVVHGQEFVFDADSTRKIGPQNLLAMMKAAKGYDQGGYVGNMPIQTANQSQQNSGVQMNVVINNMASDQVAVTTKQTTDSAGNPTLEVMATMLEGTLAGKIASGRGKLHDSIQSKFGLRSQPGR